jgi:hypothetical protein
MALNLRRIKMPLIYIYICWFDTKREMKIMNSEGGIAADFITDSRAVVLVVLFWYQWSSGGLECAKSPRSYPWNRDGSTM